MSRKNSSHNTNAIEKWSHRTNGTQWNWNWIPLISNLLLLVFEWSVHMFLNQKSVEACVCSVFYRRYGDMAHGDTMCAVWSEWVSNGTHINAIAAKGLLSNVQSVDLKVATFSSIILFLVYQQLLAMALFRVDKSAKAVKWAELLGKILNGNDSNICLYHWHRCSIGKPVFCHWAQLVFFYVFNLIGYHVW